MSTVAQSIERVYRSEASRVLATLIRLLRDFDLAEEVAQEAFGAAVEQWETEGIPANPAAWLIGVGRKKAIDRLRRSKRYAEKLAEIGASSEMLPLATLPSPQDGQPEPPAVEDDRLRLIFTCCHPALPLEAQVALTLRTLCGLTTEAIAHAFLVPPTTMAQRLVRAKAKIHAARIPYRVPDADVLPERIEAVLAVVYLVFTEGYGASSGEALVRRELCSEGIRLARLVVELVPDHPEATGLLALLLLQDSRRDARVDAGGDLVLLEDQDRARWDRAEIAEGLELVRRALVAGPRGDPGPYALQAAIAGIHAQAADARATDWPQIVALYGLLARVAPSPVVALNHAVAVAMAYGPERGLDLMDGLHTGELDRHHLFHAARADLARRLGRTDEALVAYQRARELVLNDAERRYLDRRIEELGAGTRRADSS
jgi:RNA polymerase sigma-70 factor (ECF subfamily)